MIRPPTTPVAATIMPVDIEARALGPPLPSLLVSTTAPDPVFEPDPEELILPVVDGAASGVWGTMVLVGAETPLSDAATLNGAFPFES